MRILFITFFFPPRKAIACVRTAALCKALLEAGHDVHVLTSEDRSQSADFANDSLLGDATPADRLRITRVRSWWHDLHDGPGFRNSKRLLQKARLLMVRVAARLLTVSGFDPMLPWAIAAWAAAKKESAYDCVLVSAGPFSTLITASLTAQRLKASLILDYRDPWNGAPHAAARCSTRWLEQRLLKRAALVTSVSPSCLDSIIKNVDVPSIMITNGISDDVSRLAAHIGPAIRGEIAYAGAFYPPTRSFEPIAAALALIRRTQVAQPPLAFSYLGPSGDYVKRISEEHGISDIVRVIGPVSRNESLLAQARSLCTVVITSIETTSSSADQGTVTGKLFEAMALAPWVMVISPPNSDVRNLTSHLPHLKHFHGDEIQAMADWLMAIATAPATRQPSECWLSFTWPVLGRKFVVAVEAATYATKKRDGRQGYHQERLPLHVDDLNRP